MFISNSILSHGGEDIKKFSGREVATALSIGAFGGLAVYCIYSKISKAISLIEKASTSIIITNNDSDKKLRSMENKIENYLDELEGEHYKHLKERNGLLERKIKSLQLEKAENKESSRKLEAEIELLKTKISNNSWVTEELNKKYLKLKKEYRALEEDRGELCLASQGTIDMLCEKMKFQNLENSCLRSKIFALEKEVDKLKNIKIES